MSTARFHTGPAALFAALCALAFGLAAWLHAARMEATLTEVEASRILFTLADLGADFEKSLDRGYDITQLANAQAALEAEARNDPDILSLSVSDARGRQAFHTGQPALIGGAQPLARAFYRSADGIIATLPLTYNHGALAGTLLMRYSERPHARIMAAIWLRLALAASAATALSTLVFVACLRHLERRRQQLAAQVDEALGGGVRRPSATDPELHQLVDSVNQTSATALVELTAARHALSASEVQS